MTQIRQILSPFWGWVNKTKGWPTLGGKLWRSYLLIVVFLFSVLLRMRPFPWPRSFQFARSRAVIVMPGLWGRESVSRRTWCCYEKKCSRESEGKIPEADKIIDFFLTTSGKGNRKNLDFDLLTECPGSLGAGRSLTAFGLAKDLWVFVYVGHSWWPITRVGTALWGGILVWSVTDIYRNPFAIQRVSLYQP